MKKMIGGNMIKVKELTQTCNACPSQWEGTLTNGKSLYIRYRWGYLSIDIDDKEILGKDIGDSLAGCLDEEEMKPYLLQALKEYSSSYVEIENINDLLFE